MQVVIISGLKVAVPLLQMTYLMDDVGIPADYRHMNGSGVHTFALISSSGNSTFVKFHWVPTLGERPPLDIGQLASMGNAMLVHCSATARCTCTLGSDAHFSACASERPYHSCALDCGCN